MSAHERSELQDKVLGKVKEMAGSIIRDEDLKEEGRLHMEHANAVTQSEEAAALAAQSEAEAAVVSRQEELNAEGERLMAEELRKAEIDQVERARSVGHAEIDAEARQKAILLAVRHAEQKVAVENTLATALSQREMAEISAAQTERQAVQARQVADAFDHLEADLRKDRG